MTYRELRAKLMTMNETELDDNVSAIFNNAEEGEVCKEMFVVEKMDDNNDLILVA